MPSKAHPHPEAPRDGRPRRTQEEPAAPATVDELAAAFYELLIKNTYYRRTSLERSGIASRWLDTGFTVAVSVML